MLSLSRSKVGWTASALAVGFGLMAFSSPASATPVVSGTTSNTGFTVAAGDLNNGHAPSAISGTQDHEGLNSDTTGRVLTDGQFGPADLSGTPGNYLTIVNDGASITYTFASPVTITEIDTYTGWRDGGRVNQDYILSVNGSPLATVAYDPGSNLDTKVAITDTTGTLATGVTSINFSFPSTQNGFVGYRELDVIPEPASFGLLGLGAIGLIARRRRA